jgi:hypothetical protein
LFNRADSIVRHSSEVRTWNPIATTSVSISRVTGLADFGFTQRQRKFVVTVMVHSGCFLELQDCTVTGTARGQNSRVHASSIA